MEEEEHQAWLASQKQEEEVNVVSDDEEFTFEEAVEILHHVRGDHVTEEMIDEARGLITRAVAWELRDQRGVSFDDDSLGDWIACGEFDGDETVDSLVNEWLRDNDYYEVEDEDAERRARYEEEYA